MRPQGVDILIALFAILWLFEIYVLVNCIVSFSIPHRNFIIKSLNVPAADNAGDDKKEDNQRGIDG